MDHSKGPESCNQDTLPREKTKGLMSEYFRERKSESFGKKKNMFSIFLLPLLKIFATISWLEMIPGISSIRNSPGTYSQGLSVAQTQDRIIES